MRMTEESPKVATRKRKAPVVAPAEPVQAGKEVVEQSPLPAPPAAHTASVAAPSGKQKATKGDPFKKDFRKFLWAVWKHRLGVEPSPLHYDIAKFLQDGPDRCLIMGFRGMSKSWITAAFVLWVLYCDPQKRILVVSGNGDKAKEFTRFCLDLLREMPLIKHLYPNDDSRRSAQSFDVAGAKPDQAPSVKARGITGQITGSRADIIVADDVETAANSMTVAGRSDIAERTKEFAAIIKPEAGSRIIWLGTPQTEASIYNGLPARGYTIRVWPSEVPTDDQEAHYGSRLSPYVRAMKLAGTPPGSPTDPMRFPKHVLEGKRTEYGASGYALQFMLDTRLSDAERYPLKLSDLIVMSLDSKRGPESVAYAKDNSTRLQDLQVAGFDGDAYYGPIFVSKEFHPWSGVRAFIDPSGRGGDETGFSIVAELFGMLYVLKAGGFPKGYDPSTLEKIARTLVQWNVSEALIEDNFGDGMFTALLQPYVIKAWKAYNEGALRVNPKATPGGTTLKEVKHTGVQKELRIINLLEPLMNQHRIVMNRTVIEEDLREIEQRVGENTQGYSLFYQMSHLTKERACLPHDDRIEAVAGGVEAWADTIDADPEEMARRATQERAEEWIEEWLDGPMGSGMKKPGGGVSGATRWDTHGQRG